jgi:predicted transcriptional regulator
LVRGFGDLEAVIMDRMWSRGTPATVREMLADLSTERKIAYTTVMTVMDNLYRKGWLTRELEGRAYRYAPTDSREKYSAALMREALADSRDADATLVRFLGMAEEDSEALRQATPTPRSVLKPSKRS